MAHYFPTGSCTTAIPASTSSIYVNVAGGAAGASSYGTVTLNGASGTGYNWATSNYASVTASTTAPSIQVTGNAEFEGDIKWKGKDLGKLLETIEKRLAILTPDPKKLEKFEALRKAYDHYKLLEALCYEDDDDK